MRNEHLLIEGCPLIYIGYSERGCAVVFKIEGGLDKYSIVTDYGNLVVLTKKELTMDWAIPHWYVNYLADCKEMGIAPELRPLKERFEFQIELLRERLKTL